MNKQRIITARSSSNTFPALETIRSYPFHIHKNILLLSVYPSKFFYDLDKANSRLYNFDVCSRSWRNRHTRTFEGRVRQRVRVQVPSTAHQRNPCVIQHRDFLYCYIVKESFIPCAVYLLKHVLDYDIYQIVQKTGLQPISDSNPVLVEMRGVEPLSENPSEGLSPSAFRDLNSLEKRPRKNECQGSFINTDSAAKLKRNSFPASMTPAG